MEHWTTPPLPSQIRGPCPQSFPHLQQLWRGARSLYSVRKRRFLIVSSSHWVMLMSFQMVTSMSGNPTHQTPSKCSADIRSPSMLSLGIPSRPGEYSRLVAMMAQSGYGSLQSRRMRMGPQAR